MSVILNLLLLLFLLVFLLSFPVAIVGLIKPSKLKTLFRKIPSRKMILISFVVVVFVSFIGLSIAASAINTPTQQTNNTSIVKQKPASKAIEPSVSTVSWKTYNDITSDYTIKYLSQYYIYGILWSKGGEPNNVDFDIPSNNLTTENDKNAFSIIATDQSSFSDDGHTIQGCKDSGFCTYKRVVNSNKVPLDCFNVGTYTDTSDQTWFSQANSYICRYQNINTDLLIWINSDVVDPKTRDAIINSFALNSNPKSQAEITQEVDVYGTASNNLNAQVVAQSLIITKDLAEIGSLKYAQLQSTLPQIKSDIQTAQNTFQQVYESINSLKTPSEMEATHAHFAKAVNAWRQATKQIMKGINDNNESEILSAQDIIKAADTEVKKATDELNSYKYGNSQ